MKEYIIKRVHELYWKEDINCARTALICLSEVFKIAIEPQTIRCFGLRPMGFSESDSPHMCENLTCNGIGFAYQYILGITKK